MTVDVVPCSFLETFSVLCKTYVLLYANFFESVCTIEWLCFWVHYACLLLCMGVAIVQQQMARGTEQDMVYPHKHTGFSQSRKQWNTSCTCTGNIRLEARKSKSKADWWLDIGQCLSTFTYCNRTLCKCSENKLTMRTLYTYPIIRFGTKMIKDRNT